MEDKNLKLYLCLYVQSLIAACTDGDLQKVQALLKAKTSVNIQNEVSYVYLCCFGVCSGIIMNILFIPKCIAIALYY